MEQRAFRMTVLIRRVAMIVLVTILLHVFAEIHFAPVKLSIAAAQTPAQTADPAAIVAQAHQISQRCQQSWCDGQNLTDHTAELTWQETQILFQAAEIETGVSARLLKAIAYGEGLGSFYDDHRPRQFFNTAKGHGLDSRITLFQTAFTGTDLLNQGIMVTIGSDASFGSDSYGLGIMQLTFNISDPPYNNRLINAIQCATQEGSTQPQPCQLPDHVCSDLDSYPSVYEQIRTVCESEAIDSSTGKRLLPPGVITPKGGDFPGSNQVSDQAWAGWKNYRQSHVCGNIDYSQDSVFSVQVHLLRAIKDPYYHICKAAELLHFKKQLYTDPDYHYCNDVNKNGTIEPQTECFTNAVLQFGLDPLRQRSLYPSGGNNLPVEEYLRNPHNDFDWSLLGSFYQTINGAGFCDGCGWEPILLRMINPERLVTWWTKYTRAYLLRESAPTNPNGDPAQYVASPAYVASRSFCKIYRGYANWLAGRNKDGLIDPTAGYFDAQIFANDDSSITKFPQNGQTIDAFTCTDPTSAIMVLPHDTSPDGCKDTVLSPNDDLSTTSPIPLGFTIDFFGASYERAYVNNNGNITFDSTLPTYTPFNLLTTNRVIIAPFFADVDTRSSGSSPVTYSYGATWYQTHRAFCVNWINVGYYSYGTDKLNSFQLVLVERSDRHQGDFDIYMNYEKVQWESGSASGGSGGLGGTSARIGYSNGRDSSIELPGLAANGAFLDTNVTTGLIHGNLNAVDQPGRYVFSVQSGIPPTGGSISGTVFENSVSSGRWLSQAFVQVCDRTNTCQLTMTNASGQYVVSGLKDGTYTAMAYPPASSRAQPDSIEALRVTGAAALTGKDIVLPVPTPPPADVEITSRRVSAEGIPIIHRGEFVTLTAHGCAGGAASYRILQHGVPVRSGGMRATQPEGTYSARINPLLELYGFARVEITIANCASPTMMLFDIYIDPSGVVRTVAGAPIADATVTLYRADSPIGPFEQVPLGSGIMAPVNRHNPDRTDVAGHFGWDVLAGYYKVRAAKAGCVSPASPDQDYVESAVLTIPPPVTDLDLRLRCGDSTPPATTATLSAPPNGAGWHRQDVAVNLSAIDNADGPGVQSISYSADGAQTIPPTTIAGSTTTITITAEGQTTLTFFASDNDGNAEAPQTLTVRLDKTAPAITCASPDALWHAGDVTIACSATDGGSGLADAGVGSFALTTSVPAGTETGDAATDSRAICDLADNCATAGPVGGNKIDKQAPSITVSGVAQDGVYLRGAVPQPACTAADGGSGVAGAGCAGVVSGGTPNRVGSYTYTATAADQVGNSSVVSVTYRVIYDFSGFFQPIDNLPAQNSRKAGSALPVKFSLHGNRSLSIFAAGYPKSQAIPCGSTALVDGTDETATAGSSGLTYDAGADQYSYVWKTNPAWSGTCRQLVVKLDDGTWHRANVSFK